MRKLQSFALVAFVVVFCSSSHAAEREKDYVKIEIHGTIRTGVVAVGGETTGVTITVDKTTFELEIKDPELKKLAEKLNGKKATVEGAFEIRPGVEIKERRVVVVKKLSDGTTTRTAE